jgi:3-deoxy-D-manno-octulosonic-acid transferase
MKLTNLVYFAPFDISFLVGQIFKKIKVSALLLVETELWPGMLSQAGKHGTSVILVNGRLSAHSFPMYSLFRGFWNVMLDNVSLICARSQEDAERFKALGVAANRVTVTGNIKYDNENGKQVVSKQELGFNPADLLWVCGSTRRGENEILIETYTELKKIFPTLKLVIAPRHLGRAKDIESLARKAGLKYALRSKKNKEEYDCLIVDTFGELWKFYSACDIAFVGGSLIDSGGQNPIEPAAFSKPVLFGNYMSNFLGESRAITQKGGGFAVKDGLELTAKMKELLNDEKLRTDAGRKAYEAVQSQKGAVAKTVALINSTLAARPEGAGK